MSKPGTISFSPASGQATKYNPVERMNAAELTEYLRLGCQDPKISSDEAAEIEDQIEALVPAVIELRDHAGIELNVQNLVKYGSAEGFASLANDTRLSSLARMKCRAIYTRILAQGVKAYLTNNDIGGKNGDF